MYKVGDEVLIKGEVVEVMSNVPYPTKVRIGKDEDAYVFSNDELCCVDKIVKTYEMGLNDAWELAKKIYTLEPDEREKMIGYQSMKAILEDLSAEYVADKIEAYERENEIKVGSIVTGISGGKGVVTRVCGSNSFYVMWEDGSCCAPTKKYLKSTGKMAEGLEGLLRQIGE